jgi:hypothetical protein
LIEAIYRAARIAPLRRRLAKLISKYELGDYAFRLSIGAVDRPHYAHILFNAAQLAVKLGYPKMSALEYGVAGGNGLVSLERHAAEIEKLLPIEIEIYGFDSGKGLPPPKDYRDLPYHWKTGFFHMDETKLRRRLVRARLVLGDISQTAESFFTEHDPAPIGAIVHDFDFYSSTAKGLEMLDTNEKYLLPRIFCYFDDTIGDEIALYNDFSGQRLAIHEFNRNHEAAKICPAYYFLQRDREPWHDAIHICHFFRHSRYNTFISAEDQQLGLDPR